MRPGSARPLSANAGYSGYPPADGELLCSSGKREWDARRLLHARGVKHSGERITRRVNEEATALSEPACGPDRTPCRGSEVQRPQTRIGPACGCVPADRSPPIQRVTLFWSTPRTRTPPHSFAITASCHFKAGPGLFSSQSRQHGSLWPQGGHECPRGVCPAWAESSWMKRSQSEPMKATVAKRKA